MICTASLLESEHWPQFSCVPLHRTTHTTNSPSLHVARALYETPFKPSSPRHPTYIFTVNICLAGATKEFPSQQIPIIFQECQVEVAEKLHVLVFHSQLLWGVPVNHLRGEKKRKHILLLEYRFALFAVFMCVHFAALLKKQKTNHPKTTQTSFCLFIRKISPCLS